MALFRGQEKQRRERQELSQKALRRASGKFNDDKHTTFAKSRTSAQTAEESSTDRAANGHGVQAAEASSDSSSADRVPNPLHFDNSYKALLASFYKDGLERPNSKRRRISNDSDTAPKLLNAKHDRDLDGAEDIGAGDVLSDGEDVEDTVEETQSNFAKHFAEVNEAALKESIAACKANQWHSFARPKAGDFTVSHRSATSSASSSPTSTASGIGFDQLKLKRKLQTNAGTFLSKLNEFQQSLLFSVFHYQDVLFPGRSLKNAGFLRKMSVLHALNHVFHTRDTVIKNNAHLAKATEASDEDFRDQGFTRPKVLVILPTRQSCVRYIESLLSIWEPEQQENRKRFLESFSAGHGQTLRDKPADFRELFDGNDDDMFRLGVKFTRKTLKFYSQFYNSDIIFTSPLGMKMAMQPSDPKKEDYDFLSSIEIVLVDQADAISMQNWEHMQQIFDHLNLLPNEAHGCDFSRVRNWYLDGNARYLRQTIIFSSYCFPQLSRLFAQSLNNMAGKVRYRRQEKGEMIPLNVSPKYTFLRFEMWSPKSEPDERFKFFTEMVVPGLEQSARQGREMSAGTLLFLPSYADFVRVRNYLATATAAQDISFGAISEYTDVKDVARARSHFLSGKQGVLLYTERAHHFRRCNIKGVKRVIMYGLPENPIFFRELVEGFLGASIGAGQLDSRDAAVRALFSKADAFKLERAVGTGRYLSMLGSKKGDVFKFS